MNRDISVNGHPIQLKVKQRLIEGRVNRMAIYHRAKAVEIVDSDNSVFYLMLYKKKVLAGKRLASIPSKTFLHKMFQSGIILEGKNPLVSHLLPLEGAISVPDQSHLLTKLQQVMKLNEVAEVAGMIDAFVSKESLADVIRKIFYHYKRAGKRWNAYQTLLVLRGLNTGSEWVRQTMSSPEFSKSEALYKGKVETLLEKAPYTAEKVLFENRMDHASFNMLKNLYEQSSRTTDLLPLLMEHFKKMPSEATFHDLMNASNQLLEAEETAAFTESLYHQATKKIPSLTGRYLQQLMDEKRYNDALNLIVSDRRQFAGNSEMIMQLIEVCDPHQLAVTEQNESELFKLILQTQNGHSEKVLEKVVTRLLDIQAPEDIYDVLNKMTTRNSSLPVVEELEKMSELKNDVEHQLELGELYFKYDQYDKSIDCFTWEMEMNPNDPNPVLWLSKAYDRKGMTQEAEGYRQLSVEMLKHT